MPNVIQTITLNPGEQFILPPGATILYTSNYNELSSTCENIPSVEMKCYTMIWSVNTTQSDSPNLEDDEYVASIFIGDDEYTFVDGGGTGGDEIWPTDASAITALIPAGILLNPVLSNSDTGARHTATFTFSTGESLASQIKIKIVGPGYENGLYVFPVETEC